MQTTVTVSGRISFGTQYRATRAVVVRSHVSLFIYGFFIGVPLLCLTIMPATGYDVTRPATFGLPGWAALLSGPVFVLVILPLCHALNVWQMRRSNASVSGVLTFAVSGEGFESRGGSFDVRIRWDAIHRVVETRQFFLFYIASATAHFIPKAWAGSAEELQTMRTIIHEALGDRAKLQAA